MSKEKVLDFGKKKPTNLNIDPNSLEDVKCECECPYFEEALRFKKVSALVSPSGKDALVPIPVFLCKNCGALLIMK